MGSNTYLSYLSSMDYKMYYMDLLCYISRDYDAIKTTNQKEFYMKDNFEIVCD